MNKYIVWGSGDTGPYLAEVRADSVGRVRWDNNCCEILQFTNSNGDILAEFDNFSGWSLSEFIRLRMRDDLES